LNDPVPTRFQISNIETGRHAGTVAGPIENATGIILRTRPLTETSLIVQWLTPEAGRVASVAKGARRSNSPFRGKLDLFYLADFSFARSRSSELHTLREVKLLDARARMRTDIVALHRASYAAALIEQTTETETPLHGVYDLFHQFLALISTRETSLSLLFSFELRLLQELGLEPAETRLSCATKEILTSLQEDDLETSAALAIQAGQGRELSQFLHGFMIYHLGKIPRSRGAALTEWNS
jgi:DNA repair protein RecO (recombination protein O)